MLRLLLTFSVCTVSDIGWITGHTYVVYGPLLNGSTTFMFESTPVYPDEGRYWDMVQRHKITQFYTAPTAIRLLMRYGDEAPKKYDLSSLKVLGTVGEPINPEAWRWYYEVVGKSKCTVVDTYWQTETGGHIITNLPGVTPMKPGSCTFPFYGIDTVVLDAQTGKELTEPDEDGRFEGVMAIRKPWPGMARTCLGDHERYLTVYFKPYPGYYFTGDTVSRDKDGYHFIIGRMDDVSKYYPIVAVKDHCLNFVFLTHIIHNVFLIISQCQWSSDWYCRSRICLGGSSGCRPSCRRG